MTKLTLQWRPLLVAGAFSGLAQIAAGVAMYLTGVYFSPWSSVVSLVVLALGVGVGCRWYVRSVLLGHARYSKAFLVGAVIGVCTGLSYAAYNILSISVVYPDFMGDMLRARETMLLAGGADVAQVQAQISAIQARTTIASIAGTNLVVLSVLGAGMSALAAIAFRRKSSSGAGQGVEGA